MATKKSAKKPQSRTAKSNTNQLTQFKFRWWMALILVGVVAVLGIVILRFSHASSPPADDAYTATVTRVWGDKLYSDPSTYAITHIYNSYCIDIVVDRNGVADTWCYATRTRDINNAILWARWRDYRCATIFSTANSKFGYGGEKELRVGDKVNVYEYWVGRVGCTPKTKYRATL